MTGSAGQVQGELSGRSLVPESWSLKDELVPRYARLFGGRAPQKLSNLPMGWYGLLVELFVDIDRMLDDRAAERFEVLQITERFAGLRIYWRLGAQQTNVIDLFAARGRQAVGIGTQRSDALFERVKARVNAAAVQASRTCQVCDQPGSSGNSKGWMQTQCGGCSKACARIVVVQGLERQHNGSSS